MSGKMSTPGLLRAINDCLRPRAPGGSLHRRSPGRSRVGPRRDASVRGWGLGRVEVGDGVPGWAPLCGRTRPSPVRLVRRHFRRAGRLLVRLELAAHHVLEVEGVAAPLQHLRGNPHRDHRRVGAVAGGGLRAAGLIRAGWLLPAAPKESAFTVAPLRDGPEPSRGPPCPRA